MRGKAILWVGSAALLMGSVLWAAQAPAGKAAEAPEHHGHGRITKPWNQLSDLTEEEKAKILAVHQKALDQIHEIEAKEREDIFALLTDAQKKEITDLEAKEKEAARMARTHHGATTRPTAGK